MIEASRNIGKDKRTPEQHWKRARDVANKTKSIFKFSFRLIKHICPDYEDKEIYELLTLLEKTKGNTLKIIQCSELQEVKKWFNEWLKKPKENTTPTETIKIDLGTSFFANKLTMAENFHKLNPFFYDKNCLWWLWNTKLKRYEITDETDLILLIDESIGRGFPLLRDKKEILESLKVIGRNKIPQSIPKNWIQFKDCFYDIITDKRKKPDPSFFCVNPIPWNLGNTDNTEKLDKLFSEWVNTDEEIKLLYQIIAYCIYPDYPLARIFCLYGKGSNGKSVFLNIMSKFLGFDNCCSTSLESLVDNRFESAKLYTRLMCRLSEIHNRTLSKTSLLKNISGGDHVSIEFKNKNPFDALIYSKIIIGTNTIPISLDDTDGFFRRWLLIDFPNQFNEKRDILSELSDEIFENLAFKSIKILKEILKERMFAFEGSIENRKKRYNERANPIESFIETCCEVNVNYDILFSDLYDEYLKYLSNKSFRVINKLEFGKSLRILGYKTVKKTISGFYNTYIEGLKTTQTTQTTVIPFTPLRVSCESEQGCLGCLGSCHDETKKTPSEKNNENGEKTLHNSVFLVENEDI